MSLQTWLTRFRPVEEKLPPLDIYFLGDGVGESTIVNLQDKFSGVVDCHGGIEDTITKTMLDYLLIESIDFMQISHLHADHYSGFHALVERKKVKRFGRPNILRFAEVASIARFLEIKDQNSKKLRSTSIVKLLKAIKAKRDSEWKDDPSSYLHLGNSSLIHEIDFGTSKFKMDCIAPTAGYSDKFLDKLEKELEKIKEKGIQYIGGNFRSKFDPSVNRSSIVNRIFYGTSLILLTGDTDAGVLNSFAKPGFGDLSNIESLVLKVPHHGSDTSDATILFSEEFLSQFNRKIAIICPYNSQGLPKDEVVGKYLNAGFDVFKTSGFSGESDNHIHQSCEPDGVVRVSIQANGAVKIGTWGTAFQEALS